MAHEQGPDDLFRLLHQETRTHLLPVVAVCAGGRSHAALYECGYESVQTLVPRYVIIVIYHDEK